ncbi:MaoC/PaaZ C-terminal domain-containing protein [Psychrobacter sp. FDAARGOS_221]|uniref:MaoC/PaaZ C-terminal domain-containing protein n=1 Tax=Psychrobacter sp. FDAARGOS_221 TaxID=1975705 RepID=UPI000BB578B4|nr:MaoC/PaaZ C-terminal domain-containing protein [Psychrobacter sp. FDAARGOS_221]PNK59714.1 acyl dehydratase [Psychrobacter sp. FDAARGOS_221]
MTTREFRSLPEAHRTYGKIIKSLLPVVGKAEKGEKSTLPTATYEVNEMTIDKGNLQDYRRICGFADNGQVPPTYFAVLSQALQMNMMVDEPFPFPMLGLVHVENSVTQYRRIADTEVVSMTVSLDNLRDHDKGQQFDFVTQVHTGDELIWEGTSTYLSRQKTKKKAEDKAKKPKPKTVQQKPEAGDDDLHHIFAVPEDIGRRYAKVSGDYNLIHIHPITARALGFPSAIAHGMWSKAKCLGFMDLPEAFTVNVSFKLPILLPSEVEMIGQNPRKLGDDVNEVDFGLYSAKNDKPHLSGSITKI